MIRDESCRFSVKTVIVPYADVPAWADALRISHMGPAR